MDSARGFYGIKIYICTYVCMYLLRVIFTKLSVIKQVLSVNFGQTVS
jgi:hypothetical protein